MYRDAREGVLSRVEVAASALAEVSGRVSEREEALRALNGQIEARGEEPMRIPSFEKPEARAPLPDEAPLAELVERAGAVEAQVALVSAHVAGLDTLVEIANLRAQGKRADLRLGGPPRSVPWTYALSETLGPGLLYVFIPLAFAATIPDHEARLYVAIAMLSVLAFCAARASSRMGFLRRCRVATAVTLAGMEDTSTKNTNVPMRVANGWNVSREAYTGYTMKSQLVFSTHDGRTGRLVLRGTPYTDGVVLYDPDGEGAPKAFCVVSLACAPRPDESGRWSPRQRAWAWIRILVLAGAVAWILAAVAR